MRLGVGLGGLSIHFWCGETIELAVRLKYCHALRDYPRNVQESYTQPRCSLL